MGEGGTVRPAHAFENGDRRDDCGDLCIGCTVDRAGIRNMSVGSSQPLGLADGVGKGKGVLGLERLGDKARMRISAPGETKLWRIGSLQSWNGPSDMELVGDGVIIGDVLL